MTPQDETDFQKTADCHLCKNPLVRIRLETITIYQISTLSPDITRAI